MNLRESKSRKLKILFGRTGNGSTSKRICIPTRWTDDMGVTLDNRDVVLTQVCTNLILTKEEISEEDYIKLEKILKKYV